MATNAVASASNTLMRALAFATLGAVSVALDVGCSARAPYALAEGESSSYTGGPTAIVAAGAAVPTQNTDWLRSVRVIQPTASGPPFRIGQPIPCIFEVEVPDRVEQPSMVLAEIRKGRVIYHTRRPDRVTRVASNRYRFATSFNAGLKRPGKYEVRAAAFRVEHSQQAANQLVEPTARRFYSPSVLIEVSR